MKVRIGRHAVLPTLAAMALVALTVAARAAEVPLPREKPSVPAITAHVPETPFDILSPDDVVLYRTAFDLQQTGEWGAADR